MAIKQDITKTEAKILIYLSVVHNTKKGLSTISSKLEIEYGYLIKILRDMVAKKWLWKIQQGKKVSYDLLKKAPVEKAKEVLIK